MVRLLRSRNLIGTLAVIASMVVGLLISATSAMPDDLSASARHGHSSIHPLRYARGFQNFANVEPNAPKGGTIRFGVVGTFDSLNTLRFPGNVPRDRTGAISLGHLVYDSLLAPSGDEPSAAYGLLAETVEAAPDLTSVRFGLRKEARWHDGRPVTAADVAFTFRTLREQGAIYYRRVLRDVEVEVEDSRTVVFRTPVAGDRDFVRIVGSLPIHPEHYWRTRAVTETSLDIPLTGGPYEIVSAEAGRSIVLRRVPDYWAVDHPANVGRFNFDQIRIEFYRDDSIALEAFRAGYFDVRVESSAVRWATGYAGPALSDGRIRRRVDTLDRPGEMLLLVFNQRRALFSDIRVRRAIALTYDFDWSNKTLFHGEYQRVDSYFGDTALAATGPSGPDERALLASSASSLPAGFFDAEAPSATLGGGDRRAALVEAHRLLDEAGLKVVDGRRIDPATGKPLTIRLLYLNPELVRVLGPVARNLEQLGIELSYPSLEPTAAQKMMLDRDFDMTTLNWSPTLVPGSAERLLWHGSLARIEGTYALAGVEDAALDATIDAMIAAGDETALRTAARSFDRVMRWRNHALPLWRSNSIRLAWWDKFGQPPQGPRHAGAAAEIFDRWWWRGEGLTTGGLMKP